MDLKSAVWSDGLEECAEFIAAQYLACKLHCYDEHATNSKFMTTMKQLLNDLNPFET